MSPCSPLAAQLNAEPFERGLSLVSFDSLSAYDLVSTLNAVLKEISPDFGGNLRDETPEMTAARIVECSKILNFKPQTDISPDQMRIGLMNGDTRYSGARELPLRARPTDDIIRSRRRAPVRRPRALVPSRRAASSTRFSTTSSRGAWS